ncbi:MAG: PEP-CTERM sorting domain-containing protein [Microcystis aeruginosa L111-01]|jgi:hypothetical protein|nr:PEP-CTERM sorting domain-containing protein [Microcystis aeruginosa W13-13]NCQ81168.1 PEP-CTERM sorting domain-containing protein [Microcystis aeruginosa W13-15]NCR24860.1 PEP-CTERM sorting domain-containing protein [Microcystis aeruginosa L111-01]NCS14012.1 PEP-CTERM sorting domain-containing protein [Microcystis aeruginosa G13-09]
MAPLGTMLMAVYKVLLLQHQLVMRFGWLRGRINRNLQVATKSIQSVPEPSIILGLVTLGLGALFSKKHKQDDNNDD